MTNTNTRNRKQSRMAKVVGMLLVVALLFSSQAPAAEASRRMRIESDWSKVQAVTPWTRTTVLLYKDLAPRGKRKIKGYFHSSTAESITILLGQGQTRTVEKSDVHRVLVFRPVGERTEVYTSAGVGSVLGYLVALREGGGYATIGLFVAAFTALVLESKNSMMYSRALTPRLRFGTPERRPV